MKNIIERFFKGECYDAYKYFGAHPYKNGYVFRVYAPNALEIQVIGDFNNWNGSRHKMKKIDEFSSIFYFTLILSTVNNLFSFSSLIIFISKHTSLIDLPV